MKCRLCGYPKLTMFLDLGFSPPADQFLSRDELELPEQHYPLKVLRCDQCFFIQLSHVVDPSVLYKNDYPYEASTTKTGRLHFDLFAENVINQFQLKKTDLVIDVGSNVGVLLRGFKDRGIKVLGVDPADNITFIANRNGIPTRCAFFCEKESQLIKERYGCAKIITGSNVFAHIDDLHDFLHGVDNLLTDDGILIIEVPYLYHLLKNLEYDTIYHEHLSYISILPLIAFFNNCDFEIFDLQEVDIHGGSIRIFVNRRGIRDVKPIVNKYRQREEDEGIHSLSYLNNFSKRVEQNRLKLFDLIHTLKKEGKRIAGVSAPAKGMTLLNYCQIGKHHLDFVTEKTRLKIDKYTPGTHLRVVSDDQLIEQNIDYALLLAWNFQKEIINNLKEYTNRGGKFIVPIPDPVIVDSMRS